VVTAIAKGPLAAVAVGALAAVGRAVLAPRAARRRTVSTAEAAIGATAAVRGPPGPVATGTPVVAALTVAEVAAGRTVTTAEAAI
jgi:hypothetical protein